MTAEMKKTTAPISSVATDVGQSSNKTDCIISQNQEEINVFDIRTVKTSTTIVDENQNLLNNLPDYVKETGLFCCWRYEERNGKRTKVPYHPWSGKRAKSNVSNDFMSFEAATQAKGYDGVGLGVFNDICAIDLDGCILPDGTYTPIAAAIVSLMQSYTETSPSGKGLHILFRAKDFTYDKTRFYIMNASSGIEVYVAGATSKYVTVTGNRCEPYAFADRSRELQNLLETYMIRAHVAGSPAVNAINAANYQLTDEQVLEKAFSAKNSAAFQRLWNGIIPEDDSHSEADLKLCLQLAFWTNKNPAQIDRLFRNSSLMRPKWDRKQSGSTYGEITIQNAIALCNSAYDAKGSQKRGFPTLKPLVPAHDSLPPFPKNVFSPDLEAYIQAVAVDTQTSPDMASVIALGALSCCLQGKYITEGKPGHMEPLSLYTVIIAESGERKSSVMRAMITVIMEYEADYIARHEPEIKKNKRTREELERRISSLQKKLDAHEDKKLEAKLNGLQEQLDMLPVLKLRRFFTDDCSSEALAHLLAANHGTLSVISTEGGIFDIMAGRYSGKANFDIWLKGHSGDPIRVDRLNRETEYIPRATLSAILSMQPSILSEIMDNSSMDGRGLLARLLFAMPPSTIGSREYCSPAVSDELTANYRALIWRLMDIPLPERPKLIRLSPQALERMIAYYDEHEKFLAADGIALRAWASKYIGTVLRIAGILHCVDMRENENEISLNTLERAISIGKYFLKHAAFAYSKMAVDTDIQKAKFVLSKIKDISELTIKRSSLFQVCRGRFFHKTEDLFPSLELLESYGYIRLETPERKGAGRPADIRIIVNPDALK